MPSSARSGVTRLEVVILLILGGTALGFFLMYLPRARLNSQRVQCMNHLKRFGEGIVHFHGTKEGVNLPGLRHGFLPAARIADGYATWPVQIAPLIQSDDPLAGWDLQKKYEDQPAAARQALLPIFFCPARERPTRLGGADDAQGALGDYACVAGNGDLKRPWTGPEANGPMILGEVLEKKDNLILRWRGRVSFADLEKRGLSYTFLVGEKHVPADQFGLVAAGDGPFYDGSHPASFSRVAGLGFGLAQTAADPSNQKFGSAHFGLSHFLAADGSVRACTLDMSEEALGTMTTRGD